MADASRFVSPTFEPTLIMEQPPDVPAPTQPLRDLQIFFTSGVADPLPGADPGRRCRPIAFPDPAIANRERRERLRITAELERKAIEQQTEQSRLISAATKAAARRGWRIGHASGYLEGWWWGMAFGGVIGCALTYFAVKLGMGVA